MQTIKTTDSHVIFKKRSGRHAVRSKATRAFVKGEEKEKVLLAEGLIKKSVAQAKPEEPAEEAAAEESSEG